MKTFNVPLLSLLLILLMISCERQSLTKDPKSEPSTETGTAKKLIPVEIKSERLTLQLEYISGTSRLSRIIESNNSHILITYAPKFHRVERFKNNVLYHYSDFLVNDGLAAKVHSFDSFGKVDIPTGHKRFEYGPSGVLVDVKDYNVANELVMDRKMTYTTVGNLAAIQYTNQSNKSSFYDYTSDDKNCIFKHVEYARLLFLELPYEFFCTDANNWLSCRNSKDATEDILYSYQYNSQAYPSKITIEGPKGKETFNIVYKELDK